MELRNFCSSSFLIESATYIPRAAITLGIGPHPSYFCVVKQYYKDEIVVT